LIRPQFAAETGGGVPVEGFVPCVEDECAPSLRKGRVPMLPETRVNQTSPRRWAWETAAVREAAPSLARMLETCPLTVGRLMKRAAAIA